MRAATYVLLTLAAGVATPTVAATWGELSDGMAPRAVAYGTVPAPAPAGCPPCGPSASAPQGSIVPMPGGGWGGVPAPAWGGGPGTARGTGPTWGPGPAWGAGPSPAWGAGPGSAWGGAPSVPFDAPGVAALPPSWSTPPEALLPMRDGGLPNGAVQLWSFGQINTSTDPYNPWGLSTPFMFVPWSTPLSGWTNAQTWNWWRTRSGVRSPAW